MNKVIAWLALIFNKKICTANQLSQASATLMKYCEEDKDGEITVKEAVFILFKILMESKKNARSKL